MAARIREKLLGGDVVAAETELAAASRLAGIELQAARALTVDSLLMILRPTPTADPGRVRLVATILELDAERAQAAGADEEAERAREKAQRLLASI